MRAGRLVVALVWGAAVGCGPEEDECGDGRWGPLEACDPTYPGHELVCSAQCLLLTCGDDRLVPDETCDDSPARCGDGRLAHHELCPGAPITFADAGGPVDVLLADLDGDARAELVIAWTTPPSLSVRRGTDEGFGAPDTIALPAAPRRVLPAGVTPTPRLGDGLVVLLDGAAVTWARQDPGGWIVDSPIALPGEGVGLAAAGGRAWIASPGVGVVLVDGGATDVLAFSPAGAVDVAIGQFDADSPLDLLAVDDDGLVLRSAESGAFELERRWPVASAPETMRLGRFGSEAEPSPFIRGEDGQLYASRRIPAAEFVSPYGTIGVGAPFAVVPSFDGGPGFGPTATVGADDVVAGTATGVEVHLWTDPQVTGYLAPVAIELGGAVTAVAGGDVDGDGVPEIAAAVPSLDHVALVPMTP
jgi:hypothetical protein